VKRRAADAGYALVAAVATIPFFALIAAMVINVGQRSIVDASAEIGEAKAGAAADAGIVLAVHGLLESDPARRWTIDRRPRTVAFDGAQIAIQIEDERGKVPLNQLDTSQLEALLRYAGLDGEPLRIARDSLLDWQDDDDETRENGAEADYYRLRGTTPRNGPLRAIGELVEVRGFNRAMVDRITPFVALDTGNGSFEAEFADPRAITVMYGAAGSVEAIVRARELAGQRTAIDLGSRVSLIGRPLTIAVVARRADGSVSRRRAVVELTGAAKQPYIVRRYE